MHDLRLVGVHDDGEHLLLTGADGERFRLRIDEPLRAAVRRDRARLGQLQIEMGGALRPRDIQARIRAGESAEDVAATSGLPLEHVRRYEGPVLAEREHVADRARRVPARQVAHRPPFGDLVTERLTGRGVDAAAAVWDAWRAQGSTWTVQVAFRAGTKDRIAQWAYDVAASHLEPLDDEARWLSAPAAGDPGPRPGGRRLAAVEHVYDVEADGGVRPAGRSRRSSPAPAVPAAHSRASGPEEAQTASESDERARTLDLLDALRERRGRRQPVLPLDDDDDAADDADDAEDVDGGGLPPAAHPPASRPEELADAELLALPQASPGDEGRDLHLEAGTEDDARTATAVSSDAGSDSVAEAEQPTASAPAGPAGRPRRGRRPAVPSWDEIVFGAKRD
ncbi:septation protein SepH [Quadrisphaera sp. GCM10027208]|uniref:septation protein SepH n=1 Tax=Quadrisphaera sp. GCM10027208 TaxID=3273423 RepID=UPI0036175B02